MASQKLTNCCVAAIALASTYISTPHCSTMARLAVGAFGLAIPSFCFLAKASNLGQPGKFRTSSAPCQGPRNRGDQHTSRLRRRARLVRVFRDGGRSDRSDGCEALYLGLYNTVYILPLLAILLIVTATLSRRQLSEWHGRLLKLLSGMMMLFLGLSLVFEPDILHNVVAAITLLALSLLTTWLIIFIYGNPQEKRKIP